ncbi:hypothetical protein [Natronocalculus amylovorans]|uniref:DUF3368 domain-containing protein n=1 Tax=Natronocalculus amylovorans TaxID=2917812 RepID=A0AAE3KBK2_9EURY|nr:hypothetical protein [Natronocalculus amylovorans]MCL9817454.1 hypothetical protein [Natronocalculus amylovorans]NUE02310.1 hypothetical protein [Halorubraceae archaeon YAN]
MTRIFVDATTLIALGTIGELALLTNFSGDLVVVPRVQHEVTTEPAQTNLSRFISRYDIAQTDPHIASFREQSMKTLGEKTPNGDVDIIAAVLGHTADTQSVGVVSDDRRVRTVARGLGATVTGTIGVVVRAVSTGVSAQTGRDIIDRIDSNGLHMTGSLRQQAYTLIDDAADSPPES